MAKEYAAVSASNSGNLRSGQIIFELLQAGIQGLRRRATL
jgi:hypothetical protein